MDKVIDCTYYLCCKFYMKREADSFRSSALVMTVFIIAMNIFLFTILSSYLFSEDTSKKYVNIMTLFNITICLAIFAPLLYKRYFKEYDFNSIKSKALSYNISFTFVKLYIFISIFLPLAVLITPNFFKF